MKIICPNCDAEFKFKYNRVKLTGQQVKCLQCNQIWFQYNCYKLDTSLIEKTSDLKKLALEESYISKVNFLGSPDFTTTERLNADVQIGITEPSDRLTKTNKSVADDNTARHIDKSTFIGFSTITLICIILNSLYFYDSDLLEGLPFIQKVLLEYKAFIEVFIELILDYYYQLSQLLD